jgi:hypothetical protein
LFFSTTVALADWSKENDRPPDMYDIAIEHTEVAIDVLEKTLSGEYE